MNTVAEEMRLSYTNMDDGVHLECPRCGHDEILGFFEEASIDRANDRAAAHAAVCPKGDESRPVEE